MDISDGIKKTLLAGVGAAALTIEKSSEVVDKLVKKGELTVEQGKTLNQELKHKAEEEKKDVEKSEKKDFSDLVSSLNEDELAQLKEAISQKEEKKAA